jgi:hypothetical protein
MLVRGPHHRSVDCPNYACQLLVLNLIKVLQPQGSEQWPNPPLHRSPCVWQSAFQKPVCQKFCCSFPSGATTRRRATRSRESVVRPSPCAVVDGARQLFIAFRQGSDEAVPASRAWRGTRVALHRPHRSLWVCKSSGAFIWIVLLAAFIRNSERASMYVQWTRSIYNSRSYHHRYHVSPCMHGPEIVIPCFLLQCQFCGLKVLLCS